MSQERKANQEWPPTWGIEIKDSPFRGIETSNNQSQVHINFLPLPPTLPPISQPPIDPQDLENTSMISNEDTKRSGYTSDAMDDKTFQQELPSLGHDRHSSAATIAIRQSLDSAGLQLRPEKYVRRTGQCLPDSIADLIILHDIKDSPNHELFERWPNDESFRHQFSTHVRADILKEILLKPDQYTGDNGEPLSPEYLAYLKEDTAYCCDVCVQAAANVYQKKIELYSTLHSGDPIVYNGHLPGQPFQLAYWPVGQGAHFMSVESKLSSAACASGIEVKQSVVVPFDSELINKKFTKKQIIDQLLQWKKQQRLTKSQLIDECRRYWDSVGPRVQQLLKHPIPKAPRKRSLHKKHVFVQKKKRRIVHPDNEVSSGTDNTSQESVEEKLEAHDHNQDDHDHDRRSYPWPQIIDWKRKEDCVLRFCSATSSPEINESVCAVCARLFPTSMIREWTLDSLKEQVPVFFEALEKKETSLAAIQTEYQNCPELSNLILEPKGIRNSEKKLNICEHCLDSLSPKKGVRSKGRIPLHSVANGLCVGTAPPELPQLSWAEELLISRIQVKMYILKLKPVAGISQRKIRGSTIAFPCDAPKEYHTLPIPLTELQQYMRVIFTGSRPTDSSVFKPYVCVRRSHILKWLQWLQKNNKFYADIIIDESELNRLPDEGKDEFPQEINQLISINEDEKESKDPVPHANMDFDDNVLPTTEGKEDEVIPMARSAAVDAPGMGVSSTSVGTIAILKLLPQNIVQVKHQQLAVSEFLNPEFWGKAFPVLFPYGVGGPHDIRERKFKRGIRPWAAYLLSSCHRQFAAHPAFMFVAYSAATRWEQCCYAKVRVQESKFRSVADQIAKLRSADLEAYHSLNGGDKKKNIAEFDKQTQDNIRAIRELWKHISYVGARVPGTEFARTRMRSQIYAIELQFGLPSLYITLNPADMYGGLTFYYSGKVQDLPLRGPVFPENLTGAQAFQQRLKVVADHPVAAAKFFNRIINATLDYLIEGKQLQEERDKDKNKTYIPGGLFGPVHTYFGTVETQGRGSLHLHMVVWLKGALSPREFQERLQDESFRKRFCMFIDSCISESLPEGAINGLPRPVYPEPEPSATSTETKTEVKKELIDYKWRKPPFTPSITDEIFCNCPFHSDRIPLPADWVNTSDSKLPVSTEVEYQFQNTSELTFQQKVEAHNAVLIPNLQLHGHSTTCIRERNKSTKECRFRFPRSLVKETHIDMSSGTIYPRRNHAWVNNYNPALSAALRCNTDVTWVLSGGEANSIAFYITDYITKKGLNSYNSFEYIRLALQKFEKQFPNGVDDSLDSGRRMIIKVLYQLATQREKTATEVAMLTLGYPEAYTSAKFIHLSLPGLLHLMESETADTSATESSSSSDPTVTILRDDTGLLYNDRHQKDLHYRFRSIELEDISLYDFVSVYCVAKISKKSRGWRLQPGHPQSETHWIVTRYERKIIQLIGPRIPNKATDTEGYCRYMLLLAKPWREPSDLRVKGETWQQSFDSWTNRAESQQKLIDNVTAIQEGQSKRQSEREQRMKDIQDNLRQHIFVRNDEEDSYDMNLFDQWDDQENAELPDLDFQHTINEETKDPSVQTAMSHATLFGITANDSKAPMTTPNAWWKKSESYSDLDEFTLICKTKEWKSTIKTLKQKAIQNMMSADVHLSTNDHETPLPEDQKILLDTTPTLTVLPELKDNFQYLYSIADQWTLNPEQRALFFRVGIHFLQKCQSLDPDSVPPIRCCVHGPGGTGKTQVIKALLDLFSKFGKDSCARKAAFMGAAALAIQGRTIHSLLGIRVNSRLADTETESHNASTSELAKRFEGVWYLVIDEISMIDQTLLLQIHKRLSLATQCKEQDAPFGNLSMIFMGDFHQFPPTHGSPLYKQPKFNESKIVIQNQDQVRKKVTAWFLWEQLTDCVLFHRAQRQKDDDLFLDLLMRIRSGEGDRYDYDTLMKRTVGTPEGKRHGVSFNHPRFLNSTIIVSRNSIRRALNHKIIERRARDQGQRLVVIVSQNLQNNKRILHTRTATEILNLEDNKVEKIPGKLPLIPGCRLQLRNNLATELGLVNGAEGSLYSVIFDPNHPVDQIQPSDDGHIYVEDMPLCILVQWDNCDFGDAFAPLPSNVCPIFPIQRTFKYGTGSVQRKGFPLALAMVITAHNSQGRTMETAIVDIRPPDSMFQLSNVYVPLSRVKKLEDLLIFQWFPPETLKLKLDDKIAQEIERLKKLQSVTFNYLSSCGIDIPEL